MNGRIWCIHAGDSRFYLLRDGKLFSRTRDHSRVQFLVDAGVITEKLAETHPERNRVYSCLGGTAMPQFDVSEGMLLQRQDLIVLSTDGFWSHMPAEEIAGALEGVSILEKMPQLMRTAADRGGAGADNLSVIAVAWDVEDLGDLSLSVATITMPLHGVTTQMSGALADRKGGDDVTDEEIERAIAEIQTAIKRYTPGG